MRLKAIYAVAELALFGQNLIAELAETRPFDPCFTPAHSTVVVGVIEGGTAINKIPDAYALQIECGAVPGQDPDSVIERVITFA